MFSGWTELQEVVEQGGVRQKNLHSLQAISEAMFFIPLARIFK